MLREMARKTRFTALASNLLAAVCLGALLGLGIYVSIKTVVVEGQSTPGYGVVNISQSGWNVGCTVIGTAVGILATLGFTQHDSFLTRKGIVSSQGVTALYLRPLTTSRSFSQVARGLLNPSRIFLGLLVIVSTLTSAATVAIFGVHNVNTNVSNPLPSFPLAQYNHTFFRTQADGYFPIQPLSQVDMPILESFLYRAAYIGASITADPGNFNPFNEDVWVPSSGTIGDTSYPGLNTGGIGINLTSYFAFSGFPTRFFLPSAYTFNHLDGHVFGTHVNVTCTDATANYAINFTRHAEDDVSVYKISNEDSVDFQVVVDTTTHNWLLIGAFLPRESESDPVLTIVVPSIDESAFVCDCTYSGREYLATIAVSSRLSPLEVLAESDDGPLIGHDVKWMLASTAADFLTKPGGGSLINAWTSTGFNVDGDNNTDTAALLSAVLSQTGEAQLSLMRQNAEISSVDTNQIDTNGSNLNMSIIVARLGGGGPGWLVVYGLLLVGSLLGVLRTLRGSNSAPSDVQDPVKILELMLNSGKIDERSKLKLDEKIEILSLGR
ncbi:hypothetical protein F5884DRAFT_759683 [Xylogone sp. PMI_703]|nr:hypothetical protein F5884DRAFT_759683 [Xylogone sp. PMI_703]